MQKPAGRMGGALDFKLSCLLKKPFSTIDALKHHWYKCNFESVTGRKFNDQKFFLSKGSIGMANLSYIIFASKQRRWV